MTKIKLENYIPNITYQAETREYFNSAGMKIPRVSHIIKNCHKSSETKENKHSELTEKQRNSLILAKVGTNTHLQIHKFLLNKEIPKIINVPFGNFIKWIKEKNYKIKGSEWTKGITNVLEYGGTMDCIIEIDNQFYPCDFKTTIYDPKKAVSKNNLAQQGAYIELLDLNSPKGLVVYLGGNNYKEIWVSRAECDLYWQLKKKQFMLVNDK